MGLPGRGGGLIRWLALHHTRPSSAHKARTPWGMWGRMRLRAEGLIAAAAEGTAEAGAVEPLDADAVAELDRRHELACERGMAKGSRAGHATCA